MKSDGSEVKIDRSYQPVVVAFDVENDHPPAGGDLNKIGAGKVFFEHDRALVIGGADNRAPSAESVLRAGMFLRPLLQGGPRDD